MSNTSNILLAGVGGQGVLMASEILSRAALVEGFDVKKSEVHGMAQRGGSVVSNVRYGEKVYSPLIAEGEADILLAFEKLEALRWINYLHEDGMIITSTQRIDPLPVAIGETDYPQDVLQELKKSNLQFVSLDALRMARESGSQKVINTVLIGALANFSDITTKTFQKVIKDIVPAGTEKVNEKAFTAGNEKVK